MDRRFNILRNKARSGAALCAIALTAGLTGCVAPQSTSPTPMLPTTPPQAYTEPEQRYNNPGSLFSDSGADGLFSDNRARRVGDIVLVKLVEQTKAKHKADLTSTKTAANSFGVDALFGSKTAGIAGPFNIGPSSLSGSVGGGALLQSNSNSGITATGETKGENYVTTVMAVRVLNVLPNGLLQLEGAREVKVNAETQYMVVTGMARVSDVSSDNSILSTQVADLHVEYYGKGALSDKQKPGWFTRLMDNVWPF